MNESSMECADDMCREYASEYFHEYALDNGWIDPDSATAKMIFDAIKSDYDLMAELLELLQNEFQRQDAMFEAQMEYSKECEAECNESALDKAEVEENNRNGC